MKAVFRFLVFVVLSVSGLSLPADAQGTVKVAEQVGADLQEAEALIQRGQVVDARTLIFKADRLIDSLKLVELRDELLLSKTALYLGEQKFDSAAVIAREGISRDLPDSVLLKFHNDLGTALRFQSEYVESLKQYTIAFDMARTIGDEDIQLGILQNMAVSYKGIGMMDKAIQYFTEALAFGRQKNDTTMLVVVTNNIGNTYNEMEDYTKAAIYLRESRDLAHEAGFRTDLLRATQNLAISELERGRYEEARILLQQTYALNEEVRPGTPPFQIDYNYGNMYLKWGQPDSATKYFERSLQACEAMGIPPGMFFNHMGLGTLEKDRGRVQAALGHYRMAYDVAKGIGALSMIEASSEELYQIYKDQGNFRQALSYLEEQEKASDSLSTITSESEIAEMESRLELSRQRSINDQLESDRSRQEALVNTQRVIIMVGVLTILLVIGGMIYVIRADKKIAAINAELRTERNKLEAANKEKDRLFAIISHDMRTPLSSLQGFLFLLQDADMSPEEIREITGELEISVQKNLDLMTDLLAWAKEQMSGLKLHLRPIEVREVIEDVISPNTFIAEKKGLKVHVDVPEDTQVTADQDAIEIIMRNLLTNAIKFTRRDGNIRFGMKKDEGKVIITISDTGIGIPENEQSTVFSDVSRTRKGTQGEKGSGIGLNLSYQLANKMGGRLYFESAEGKGTTFFVELPD